MYRIVVLQGLSVFLIAFVIVFLFIHLFACLSLPAHLVHLIQSNLFPEQVEAAPVVKKLTVLLQIQKSVK